MLLLWWCPFNIQNKNGRASSLPAQIIWAYYWPPLRIRWTIPLSMTPQWVDHRFMTQSARLQWRLDLPNISAISLPFGKDVLGGWLTGLAEDVTLRKPVVENLVVSLLFSPLLPLPLPPPPSPLGGSRKWVDLDLPFNLLRCFLDVGVLVRRGGRLVVRGPGAGLQLLIKVTVIQYILHYFYSIVKLKGRRTQE